MEDDKVDSSSSNLEINPETCLQFMLTRGGGEASTPKCTMTLKHTGTSDDCIAFKVNLSSFVSLSVRGKRLKRFVSLLS